MSTHETFSGGGYYAYDAPTLNRADRHGCLDEDVNTGDPLVCRECAYPPTDGKCPTCGPTKVEPHPRRAGVTRCANCKEWLSS